MNFQNIFLIIIIKIDFLNLCYFCVMEIQFSDGEKKRNTGESLNSLMGVLWEFRN